MVVNETIGHKSKNAASGQSCETQVIHISNWLFANDNQNTPHWRIAQFLRCDLFSLCKINNARCLYKQPLPLLDNGEPFLRAGWGV